MHLSLKGFDLDSSLDIEKQIKAHIANEGAGVGDLVKAERDSFKYFFSVFLGDLLDFGKVLMVPYINDAGDVMVRLKPHKHVYQDIVDKAQGMKDKDDIF